MRGPPGEGWGRDGAVWREAQLAPRQAGELHREGHCRMLDDSKVDGVQGDESEGGR